MSPFTLPQSDLALISGSLKPDARKLAGARFLISGGTGFFGAWLVEGLLYTSQELGLDLSLHLITRDPEGFTERMPHIAGSDCVRLLRGDVRSVVLPGNRYDYVIHGATESGGAQKAAARLQMIDTIVDGTRNMLRHAEESGAKAVLHISSGAVYGRRGAIDREEIDEDYPGGPLVDDPDIDHDESKRMAEAIARIYAIERNLPVKIARCFSFVGPYLPLNAHFAAGNFLRDALAGSEIVVKGDGTAIRTYLYTADMCVWLLRILLDGVAGRAYNVAGKEPVSIGDLARLAAACADPPPRVRVMGTPSGAPPARIVASTKRAEAELGLAQTVNVEESMRRTFAWRRGRANSR